MLRCVRAQIPAAYRPPAEGTKSPRRPPAAQATPVGPNRQRPLPGSRQPVQASSRSRQRFRHAVAARQGSRPPRSSSGDRVVCRRRPRRWSRPYINPSGPSRGGPSTSPQPSITAALRAAATRAPITLCDRGRAGPQTHSPAQRERPRGDIGRVCEFELHGNLALQHSWCDVPHRGNSRQAWLPTLFP